MTGAQTDAVSIAMFDRVASALVRLASPLFVQYKTLSAGTPELDSARLFRSWQVLRETATKLTTRREIRLSKWEIDELLEAFLDCCLSDDLEFVFEQCRTKLKETA